MNKTSQALQYSYVTICLKYTLKMFKFESPQTPYLNCHPLWADFLQNVRSSTSPWPIAGMALLFLLTLYISVKYFSYHIACFKFNVSFVIDLY
jgi:hypothetical protein